MTRNVDLHPLHVNNSTHFISNLNYKIVKGDTLLLDYIFFTHPVSFCVSQLAHSVFVDRKSKIKRCHVYGKSGVSQFFGKLSEIRTSSCLLSLILIKLQIRM